MMVFTFAFVVVPRRSEGSKTRHQLEDTNVTIDCPLKFGSLRANWSVDWIALDSIGNELPNSGYFVKEAQKFQLVIRNATVMYDGARFQCRASLSDGHAFTDSQHVTLSLFRKLLSILCFNMFDLLFLLTDDAEIVKFPRNPAVVNVVENGVVEYAVKAFPSPSIYFCYNGTCDSTEFDSRVQIIPVGSNDPTTHVVRFIVHGMKEEDNGNVTCRVHQLQGNRDITVNSTVMLFVPCKYQ